MTLLDPRYPIGKYTALPDLDANSSVRARRDIAELPAKMRAAVAGLTDAQLDTPYREGGWTVRQVVHHVADSHLNAYTRFKLALTEDNPVIKPYAEALWAELPDSRTPPIESSLRLLDGLHQRWTVMLDAMTPEQMRRSFVHPEKNRAMALWSVLDLYSWHSRHHVAHITELRARKGWSTSHPGS